MSIKKLLTSLTGGLAVTLAMPLLALVPVARAVTPADYSLIGETSTVAGSGSATAIQTVSDADPGFGGIDFDVDSGLTFANLTTLSSEFNVTNDNCGDGSPRFQLNTASGNIFVYLGAHPGYNTCTPSTWVNTGDLLEAGMFVDTSQVGGTFYDTYTDAVADHGSLVITGIQLVIDSGWSTVASVGDGEQTVWFDNTVINGVTYNFEPIPTVKVTINKYINGQQATTTNANSSAFPMASSWSSDNEVGTGSGTYTLSPTGFNSSNAYEAVTSNMALGAEYSTNEVTGGSVVAASCTLGGAPFALVGYTSGDTLEAAQTAVPSTTAPAFTDLQSDKFVIVWNRTCASVVPTSKEQCKKDGWKTYGTLFKNQGDCVSYFATDGRNGPNGSLPVVILPTF